MKERTEVGTRDAHKEAVIEWNRLQTGSESTTTHFVVSMVYAMRNRHDRNDWYPCWRALGARQFNHAALDKLRERADTRKRDTDTIARV